MFFCNTKLYFDTVVTNKESNLKKYQTLLNHIHIFKEERKKPIQINVLVLFLSIFIIKFSI
jgi:hypothetical protein